MQPNPTHSAQVRSQERDELIDAIGNLISEFAKCLVVFFVFPPLLTLAAMSLMAWVR